MDKLNKLKSDVAKVAHQVGVTEVNSDWKGLDDIWPIFELMADEGAVILVKLDGERILKDDNGRYTVVVTGGSLRDDYFRSDTENIEEGVARAILRYVESR